MRYEDARNFRAFSIQELLALAHTVEPHAHPEAWSRTFSSSITLLRLPSKRLRYSFTTPPRRVYWVCEASCLSLPASVPPSSKQTQSVLPGWLGFQGMQKIASKTSSR